MSNTVSVCASTTLEGLTNEDDHIWYNVARRIAPDWDFPHSSYSYWGQGDNRDSALILRLTTQYQSLPPSERLVLILAGF